MNKYVQSVQKVGSSKKNLRYCTGICLQSEGTKRKAPFRLNSPQNETLIQSSYNQSKHAKKTAVMFGTKNRHSLML